MSNGIENYLDDEHPILDQIRAARDQAHTTGRRVRLEIPKAEFLAEIPTAASDPRITMFGDTMYLDFDVNEELTVKELRKICRESKSPLARQKLMSVLGLPDEMSVVVLKQDLIDLRDGHKSPIITAPALDLAEIAEPSRPVGLTKKPPTSKPPSN